MKVKQLTDLEIKRILELKDTHSQRDIAKAIGKGRFVVQKILNAKMLNPVKETNTHFDWKDFNNSIIM